jgi:hypothetical protein
VVVFEVEIPLVFLLVRAWSLFWGFLFWLSPLSWCLWC